MKKILITGSSGFIGKNLIECLKQDYNVVYPSHQQLDLLSEKSVENFLKKEQVDIVIHSAVQGTFGKPKEIEQRVLKNNLRMFCNLEKCRQCYQKMYYFGSGAEYGNEAYIPKMQEEYFGTAVPMGDYGFSKYIMSKFIEQESNIYNLRLFGVFGAYENYNYRFISNAICKAIQGQDIIIRQNKKFDYLYITDLCEIMKWFIENEPKYREYNICTGDGISILSIAETIKEKIGSKSNIIVESDVLDLEYSGNNSRLIQEMGEFRFTPTETGISELIDFYLKTPFQLEGDY